MSDIFNSKVRTPRIYSDVILKLAGEYLVKYNVFEYQGSIYIEIIVGKEKRMRELNNMHLLDYLRRVGFKVSDIWAQGDIVFLSFLKRVDEGGDENSR